MLISPQNLRKASTPASAADMASSSRRRCSGLLPPSAMAQAASFRPRASSITLPSAKNGRSMPGHLPCGRVMSNSPSPSIWATIVRSYQSVRSWIGTTGPRTLIGLPLASRPSISGSFARAQRMMCMSEPISRWVIFARRRLGFFHLAKLSPGISSTMSRMPPSPNQAWLMLSMTRTLTPACSISSSAWM